MTILGKVVLTCPKTKEEVSLDKDCVKCEKFEHWGMQGARPYIACSEASLRRLERER